MTGARLARESSLLLVVDIQRRLAPHIAQGDAIVSRVEALLSGARRLDIPVLATLHCPDRVGDLVPPLQQAILAGERFTKTRFAAPDHPAFVARVNATARGQIVVVGMEAHVCVMQTALGLRREGFDVFVVADAAGSRGERALDRELALERLRAAGCTLAGTETVLFEWARDGEDAAFRDLLARVKALPPN